jgi:hypothetical protein
MNEQVTVIEVLMLGFGIAQRKVVTSDEFHENGGLSETGTAIALGKAIEAGWIHKDGDKLTLTKVGAHAINDFLAREPKSTSHTPWNTDPTRADWQQLQDLLEHFAQAIEATFSPGGSARPADDIYVRGLSERVDDLRRRLGVVS